MSYDGQSRRKKVLVLGAGLAGLCAAYELTQAGHEVTVLEASRRPGGRVHTLRKPFSGGLYAEAGAMYVPASHDRTLHYIRQFEVGLLPLRVDPASTMYFVRGRPVWLDAPNGGWPLDLTREEQKLGLGGIYDKYITPALWEVGEAAQSGWSAAILERYDELSFAQFLIARGASAGAVELLRLGYMDLIGEGIEHVSALSVLLDQATMSMECFVMDGGSDRLVDAFVARLSQGIRYEHAVVAIRQDDTRIQIVVERDGRRETLAAEYAVCTLPFSVLRGVDFDPALSPEKRAVIQEMQYTSATRVYLQSREEFWSRGAGMVSVNTDSPVMSCISVPCRSDSQQGILQAEMAGSRARAAAAMDKHERVRFVLKEIARFFPDIRSHCELGTSYCWDQAPWARGAYPWFRPGRFLRLQPVIRAAEGRLVFSGEHTSHWTGWMQGALDSGQRAAREIETAP